MRLSIPAGVLVALAFLVPAAPAAAQAAAPGLNQACQTVERKVYTDIRGLVTIDLDAAADTDVRVLANQVLAAANGNSLSTLPGKVQERLDGTEADLRAFLKTNLPTVFETDLRVAVNQTLTDAGANVKTAAQKVLDDGSVDALLAYLNDGLYVARALDCTASPTPSASPSASPSAATSPSPGRAAAGGLPVTGTNTGVIAIIGAALVLLGTASIVVARRRRTNAGA